MSGVIGRKTGRWMRMGFMLDGDGRAGVGLVEVEDTLEAGGEYLGRLASAFHL